MTDQPTPEKTKAFLKDVARAIARHGVQLEEWCAGFSVRSISAGFSGYGVRDLREVEFTTGPLACDIHSFNPTQISNRERMQVVGGQE